ncbi:MAG: DUF3039 domain-containing protein [Cellulomonadaceae bacterium]|nr:DUF3039 domain-containing protein [Cellulomonadaceae bacterium]
MSEQNPSPWETQSTGTGTAILERPDTELRERLDDTGDHDRFAHYVKSSKLGPATAAGKPVVALCGKVWVPGRDPKDFAVCPACKEIYETLSGGTPNTPV